MQKVKKEVWFYIASDGKRFMSQKECKDYEDNTLNRLKNIKTYIIYGEPHATKDIGYSMCIKVAVEAEEAEKMCKILAYALFGPEYKGNNQKKIITNWQIEPITKPTFTEFIRRNYYTTYNGKNLKHFATYFVSPKPLLPYCDANTYFNKWGELILEPTAERQSESESESELESKPKPKPKLKGKNAKKSM